MRGAHYDCLSLSLRQVKPVNKRPKRPEIGNRGFGYQCHNRPRLGWPMMHAACCGQLFHGLENATLLEIRYLIAAVFLAEDLSFTRQQATEAVQSGTEPPIERNWKVDVVASSLPAISHVAITDCSRASLRSQTFASSP